MSNTTITSSAEQNSGGIAEMVESVNEKKFDMDGSLTRGYIELLSDLSFIIDSIQKGYGNRCREKDEQADKVLAELREAFGYEYVSDRIWQLLALAEYEKENNRLLNMITKMTKA